MPAEVRVPGDKSIGHRALILASLADGVSRVRGLPASFDLDSTRRCLRSLGVRCLGGEDGVAVVHGPTEWRRPLERLDCGNSGTTARLLTGLIAGLGLPAEVGGDPTLSQRPMDRVVYPLQAMGARIAYLEKSDRLPIRLSERASGALRALRYRPRVSSAQVRGALLLAALAGRTDVEVLDRGSARDHTERMLAALAGPVSSSESDEGQRIHLAGSGWDGHLRALDIDVPGDLSSAAFLVVAGLLAGRRITVERVGLNPTRLGFVEILGSIGARVETRLSGEATGEPYGDLVVAPGNLRPFEFGAEMIPRLVDEIPALAILASRIEGVSEVRGAAELRFKESDRLSLLVSNLRQIGVECEELPDGLRIQGTSAAIEGPVRTGGDHRMAMAFAVLGRSPGCRIAIDDVTCVDVSFPGFFQYLNRIAPARETA